MQMYYQFADVYGQGSYGECVYSAASQATCESTSSGGLANTGIAVLGFATLACLIIFAALIIRFAGRRKKRGVKQESDHQAPKGSQGDVE